MRPMLLCPSTAGDQLAHRTIGCCSRLLHTHERPSLQDSRPPADHCVQLSDHRMLTAHDTQLAVHTTSIST
jgi:hypothetical protein